MSSKVFKYNSESGEIPLDNNTTELTMSGMAAEAVEKMHNHMVFITVVVSGSRKSSADFSVTT